MLGAIVGDIVGSRFERHNLKSKDFELFTSKCHFTDDTVMSLAVGDALIVHLTTHKDLSELAIESMQKLGREYLNCGFGHAFKDWLKADSPAPYNSFGNGSAMRVCSCGELATSLNQVKEFSDKVTRVSHNHPEGLKGAEAVAVAVFKLRQGIPVRELKEYIQNNYYAIDFTLDEIRDSYKFSSHCQDSVPQAFEAFFEGQDFEDTIRNAVSIGGDSDTIAAIAGSMAEIYFGIPENIKSHALEFLDAKLLSLYRKYCDFQNKLNSI